MENPLKKSRVEEMSYFARRNGTLTGCKTLAATEVTKLFHPHWYWFT